MFVLKIETFNAAFDGDDRGDELQRCVRNAMDDIAHGKVRGKIWDSNGNVVGSYDCEAAEI